MSTEFACARTLADKGVPIDWKLWAPLASEVRRVYRILRNEFGFDERKAARRILCAIGHANLGETFTTRCPSLAVALVRAAAC